MGKHIFITTALFLCATLGFAQWKKTTLRDDSDVRALVANDTHVFAGLYGGGVLSSSNNGKTWELLNKGMNTDLVMALAVSGQKVLAGTKSAIYFSENNGQDWTEINNGLPLKLGNLKSDVLSVAISGTALYAGTQHGGLYRSTNNGDQWTQQGNGIPVEATVYSLLVNGTDVLAATEKGIFISTDGQSWALSNGGLSNIQVRSLTKQGDLIFAGTFGGGIHVSDSNGKKWKEVNDGIEATYPNVTSMAASKTFVFAGIPGNEEGSGVLFSTNSGTSWITAKGLQHPDVLSMLVKGNTIFVGMYSGGLWMNSGIIK